MDPIKKQFATKLLGIKAIKLQPNEPFTWASGWRSPIYTDNRKTLAYPEIRSFVKQELVHLVHEHFPEAVAVAGVATGAIAQGALVAEELDMPFCYVRSKPKDHGMGNLIEGTEGIAVQLANCCHPVPGDTVWGFMRKGHGLSIHRADCEHTKHGRANDAERWSEARWCKNRPADARFPVPVELSVTDKLSALPAVAAELAKAGSSIIGVAMTDEKKGTTLEEHELSLVIQVKDKKHLVHTLLQLKQLPMVTAVARKIDGDKKVAV